MQPLHASTALAIALLAGPLAAQTRGLAPEDYFRFQFVSDPRVSPDGKQVAFVRGVVDREKNRRMSSVWLVPTDGGAPPRQLTASAFSSSSPRWSPDGRQIAFLSSRDGTRAQIHLLPLEGGEARQLTRLSNGTSSFEWSPDGKRFVLLSRIGPSDRLPKKTASDVRHYTYSRCKFNDTGWFDDKRSHLWIADTATGEAKQITEGDDWNDLDPHWSPDGKEIAFVSDRTGREFEFSRNTDIWVVALEGGAPRKITTNPEADGTPRWSPDGSAIAYLESKDAHGNVAWKLAPCCAAPREIAPKLDMLIGDPQWETDASLFFSSPVKGETSAYQLDIATGAATRLTPPNKHCREFSARGSKLAAVCNDFEHIDELYSREASGSWRALTSFNAELWKGLDVASVERVPYRASDGWDIDGFLVKPIGWQSGKKYPLVLSIHGGPAGMYGTDFNHEHEDAQRLISETPAKDAVDALLLASMRLVTDAIYSALKPVFPAVAKKPSQLRRIEWEANNWHYDIGVASADNYDIQSSIGPPDRTADRLRPGGPLATMAFPINTQGPTVVVPWAGEYAGKRCSRRWDTRRSSICTWLGIAGIDGPGRTEGCIYGV